MRRRRRLRALKEACAGRSAAANAGAAASQVALVELLLSVGAGSIAPHAPSLVFAGLMRLEDCVLLRHRLACVPEPMSAVTFPYLWLLCLGRILRCVCNQSSFVCGPFGVEAEPDCWPSSCDGESAKIRRPPRRRRRRHGGGRRGERFRSKLEANVPVMGPSGHRAAVPLLPSL